MPLWPFLPLALPLVVGLYLLGRRVHSAMRDARVIDHPLVAEQVRHCACGRALVFDESRETGKCGVCRWDESRVLRVVETPDDEPPRSAA